jgi:hypothetical protein
LLILLAATSTFVHATERQTPTRSAKVEPLRLDFNAIATTLRDKVRSVVEKPSLSAKGPSETFNTHSHVYRWLLDHPDKTIHLWRTIGATVAEIETRPDGYHFSDESGTQVHWQTVLAQPGIHVWFAEGKVKPSVVLPLTSFRAVGVMQYKDGPDTKGLPAVRHQVHFFVQCDSRAAALVLRLFGASAPKVAEQHLEQLQLFYGGMAWHLYQDEARARRMYRKIGLILPENELSQEQPRSPK